MKFIAFFAILFCLSVHCSNAAELPRTVEVDLPFNYQVRAAPVAAAAGASPVNCQPRAPSCQPKVVATPAPAPLVSNCQPKAKTLVVQQQQQAVINCQQPQSSYYCLIKSVPYTSLAISRVVRTQFQQHQQVSSSFNTANNPNGNFVLYLDNQFDRPRFNQELLKHRESMQDFGSFYRIYEEPPQCNREFCEHFGNGINFFKVCSPEHCHCANGEAFLQACNHGTVFDPRNKICNWPKNVIGC